MFTVILQMSGLIFCGVSWRWLQPGNLDAAQVRKALTSFVYHLLLPALVLSVLWKAELGANSILISAAATLGVLSGFLISTLSCRVCELTKAQAGALILAIAFPNATYMGLPTLEATFGPWARSIAIQYDLFACTPLLFTIGVMIAARHGSGLGQERLITSLFKIPSLWAAILAVLFNIANVPLPEGVDGFLQLLGRGVTPLVLFALGLSLEWKSDSLKLLRPLLPVLAIRLFLIPAIVMLFLSWFDQPTPWKAAVIMEAGMPSMVIGIVICEQFELDMPLYATAVTLTTLGSLISLPLWYHWLM